MSAKESLAMAKKFGVVLFLSVIWFLSPKCIFTSLRRRHSDNIVNSLRKLLKCRSKCMSVNMEIKFLQRCLEEAVVPRWMARRIIKAKVKYSHKMEKAFLTDDINSKEEHLQALRSEQKR